MGETYTKEEVKNVFLVISYPIGLAITSFAFYFAILWAFGVSLPWYVSVGGGFLWSRFAVPVLFLLWALTTYGGYTTPFIH